VVSNVIGGGIFFTPVFIAQLLPNPLAILSVWLVGGLLSLAGARVYYAMAGDGAFMRAGARIHPQRQARWSSPRERRSSGGRRNQAGAGA
jgi:APA family basic amino acid/polyamine antiporter